MPVSAKAYGEKKVRSFFGGLLPEGEARRILAYDFKVDETDVLGLLAILGRDCAGALEIAKRGKTIIKRGLSLTSNLSRNHRSLMRVK
jgi:serine/threonine-protein kinase HipA